MSDNTAQQTLAVPMIEVHGAGARTAWPREFLTLSLVAACLSFWTVILLVITHLG